MKKTDKFIAEFQEVIPEFIPFVVEKIKVEDTKDYHNSIKCNTVVEAIVDFIYDHSHISRFWMLFNKKWVRVVARIILEIVLRLVKEKVL